VSESQPPSHEIFSAIDCHHRHGVNEGTVEITHPRRVVLDQRHAEFRDDFDEISEDLHKFCMSLIKYDSTWMGDFNSPLVHAMAVMAIDRREAGCHLTDQESGRNSLPRRPRSLSDLLMDCVGVFVAGLDLWLVFGSQRAAPFGLVRSISLAICRNAASRWPLST
jgi:hypothetical protein